MSSMGGTLVLRGYAEKCDGWWQAICIDLDIAAQGKTLTEARETLNQMVESYLEAAADYPPAERRRLLNRKAPLSIRFGFFWRFLMASFFANRTSRDTEGFISHVPCPI